MSEFFQIVSNLGFPIAVSCYLLFRFEKKLDKLEDTVKDMTRSVEENTEIVKGCKGRRK